jgi:RNA polymerase sigma factor (sigma-70 family)
MLVEMSENDHELLTRFVRESREADGQDAFTGLVGRYMNLVYSAALRQVRSPQLAEEVCQSVFINLARNATHLRPDTILTAWLYQVTRHATIDVVRREARRQAREQLAIEMSDMNNADAAWSHVEPLLDEAMQSIDEADRAAILLRYFENKSLREVGVALGTTEDAAQKRVSRALERLRAFFAKRKVTVAGGSLAALVSANAVQAAPAGLTAVAAAAALASTPLTAATTVAVTKAIAMTTLQKTIVAVLVTGGIAIGIYQTREVSNLRQEVRTLEAQRAQAAALSDQVAELRAERDRATNALAAVSAENAALKKSPGDVLKLRGEVGRLRQEKTEIGSKSALSKVTANPESRQLLRDQQKLGMGMLYKGFVQKLKLASDQTDKFNELLADHIMDNVDHVTTVLRDKPAPEQINEIFAAEEAALQEKVQTMLGQDGLAQYQDYTRNLLSSLTAQQFSGSLTGTQAEKEEKSKQLSQAIQEESRAALTSLGLPADYQTIPMLNFRNIASEQEGEKSLKLLEDIYQRAATRCGTFLSAEELTKFQEFSSTAIKNNRSALSLNRTIMAPISD